MKVLVTGASRGIGAALTADLLAAGHEVWTLSRQPGPGNWIACDLRRPETFPDVVPSLPQLDAVIHSAGIWEETAFSDAYDFAARPARETLDIIAVNLAAPILLTQALLPNLNAGARVVLIGSTSGLERIGRPEVAYNASKAGLRGAAEALHLALKGQYPVTLVHLGDAATLRDEAGLIPVADIVSTVRLALSLSARTYLPELTIEPTGV